MISANVSLWSMRKGVGGSAPNLGPSITSSPVTSGTTDTLYQYQVTATDPEGDTLTFSLSVKPSGMTINATTGLIQYTPTAVSTPNVTVVVTDTKLNSATQSYTINVVQQTLTIQRFLIVAGAGSGGSSNGGGGGAGGFYDAPSRNFIVDVPYAITIGAGGSSPSNGAVGNNGSDSKIVADEGSGSATIYQSKAGGGGGCGNSTVTSVASGQDGGSGGGAGGGKAWRLTAGNTTDVPKGDAVNTGYNSTGEDGGVSRYYAPLNDYFSGGGGGGQDSSGTFGLAMDGGNGGDGGNWQSLGTYYAAGGGGATEGPSSDSNKGHGGTGGGGYGARYMTVTSPTGTSQNPNGVINGTVNRGSGGGGGSSSIAPSIPGGQGGSGVVIFRYSGSTTKATGGTVTTAGGYVYHTFNSSGTFTPTSA